MSPATHFLIGWMVANTGGLERRDRAAVTLAGVAPDFDAFGVVPELLTRGTSHPLAWFSQYHHILGHNVAAAFVVGGICFAIAKRRWRTALLALVSFHLHLFCDIVGAKGPDGYGWPVPYLLPFSDKWQLVWSHQWPLNGWQNFAITGALLGLMFYWAWKRGYSVIEMASTRADRVFVQVLRNRFGNPSTETVIHR